MSITSKDEPYTSPSHMTENDVTPQVRSDSTIWFDLDCMDLDETQYCGFGFSEPSWPSDRHHDSEIYTAHRSQVEDR